MSREGQQSAGAPSVGGDLGRPSAATGQEVTDPVFAAEQAHLSETYGKLEKIGRDALAAMEAVAAQAAEDKKNMAEELAVNFATWDDILETHADIVAMNNIIEAHDMANSVQAERLRAVEVLLREPYFAKIALQFKEGAPAKELYIGSAGISDENYRRLVVDWRSPVAEVYYNQTMGPTSYVADGRTIHVDLKLRRQFEIEEDRLITYFDSDVAIEDKLLLASLSRGRSAHMQAITATIQREQNAVVRHEDVPVLQVAARAKMTCRLSACTPSMRPWHPSSSRAATSATSRAPACAFSAGMRWRRCRRSSRTCRPARTVRRSWPRSCRVA